MDPGRAHVDEFCQHLPELRTFEDVIIRTRKVAPHAVLFTLYGQHVLVYITKSMNFRTTDPYSHSNEVTRDLFTRVFGDRYEFTFNQLLKMERSLLLPRLKQLVLEGFTLGNFVSSYEQDREPFVNVEIDACLHLEAAGTPPRRFEIKLFTCPGQSGRVLAQHLFPQPLKELFVARDFVGFISFATVHGAGDIARPPRYNDEVPEAYRTGWFLHLAVVDVNVLRTAQTAIDRAEQLLTAMRDDHAFLAGNINLNTNNCSISMIENYVKVIHMAYVIEQLRRDLQE
ncbi:MAG: hypothetical protein JW839_10235, partial [Candidatus Lokiarchaeota archaeon]|nr:hypothetical protein [Candidatus Lokiarchaeota archaeon]